MTHDALRAENAKILDTFRAKGTDLTVERNIDFTCDFPDEETARRFVDTAKADGIFAKPIEALIEVFDPEDPSEGFDCKITVRMIPDVDRLSEIEFLLTKLAQALGGGEVGWGFYGD